MNWLIGLTVAVYSCPLQKETWWVLTFFIHYASGSASLPITANCVKGGQVVLRALLHIITFWLFSSALILNYLIIILLFLNGNETSSWSSRFLRGSHKGARVAGRILHCGDLCSRALSWLPPSASHLWAVLVLMKKSIQGLSWWSSCQEYAVQCRGCGLDHQSGELRSCMPKSN